ncbi:MAG: terpene cyclase/mutase family protein [Planctomycetes bacterium]|nr:terpene cyclase/mutase family protein [Planctomycetota bacterium]
MRLRTLACLTLGLALAVTSRALGAEEAAPKPKPAPPPSAEELERALDRGAAFLLRIQNRDGSWGTARRTKDLNIYAPVPGAHLAFRSAVTSLCVMALTELEGARPQVGSAIDRGERWLFENLPRLRRATGDALYNVWGHGYAIQALARLARRPPQDEARLRKVRNLIAGQVDLLGRYETVDGGWGYYDFNAHTQKPTADSTSFTTATILVAFAEARDLGSTLPEKLVKRAADSIVRQRKPDFSYLYGEYLKWRPMRGINRQGGSLGRSQACNLALRLWGDRAITDEVMKTALDRLFARNLWLDIGRKRPIPHESWFQVAGYFFYYGHYYAALCLEKLPPAERPEYQAHLAAVLLRLQEKDGSWWDFPFYDYHQPYGTAYALLALRRCR